MRLTSATQDPRTAMDADMLKEANRLALPAVAISGSDGIVVIGSVLGALLLGGITFGLLSRDRTALPPPPTAAAPAPVVLPAPAPAPSFPPVAVLPPPPAPLPQMPPPAAPPPAPQPAAAPSVADLQRRQAPTLVIDLADAAASRPAAAVPGDKPGEDKLSAEDQFADRVARAESAAARAVRLQNPGTVVPQGTIIAGVLETAINSDLPGFTRAVVSQDVRSFDGSRVAIPRGSRLIGQYRSGLTVGQSRAFVVWSRLMRPDGSSIQLGSPGTDTLGRAGFAGEVDTHFFRRFGSAILLSVISGGIAALDTGNNQVIIRSSQDAQNVATVALQREINIPPTVKVPQGTPIRIFTARDLDFANQDTATPVATAVTK